MRFNSKVGLVMLAFFVAALMIAMSGCASKHSSGGGCHSWTEESSPNCNTGHGVYDY